MSVKIRFWELYSDGLGFWSHWPNPLPSANWDAPYIVKLHAKSIRQAIWLAANRMRLQDATGVGIIEVDHRDGPAAAELFFHKGGK
jgi:hypothetical protein